MAETFDHSCFEPHLGPASSGKPRFSLFQLSLLIFTSVYLEKSVLSQLITAVLLCVRALLYIRPQNLTFAVNSVHSSFDRLFLFHRSLTNKKNLKQYTAGPVTERHHSEEIIGFFSQNEELKAVVEYHMTTYSYKSYDHHGGGHGGEM